jgi:ketosteroid isomerase-like protein
MDSRRSFLEKSATLAAVGFLPLQLAAEAQAGGAAGTKSPPQTIDSKQELIALEKKWWEAFKAPDRAALERILADEFVGYDNPAGKPETKRQWIDGMTDGSFRVDSYAIERMDVTVVADTGVVAVLYSIHTTEKGKASSERKIDLDTFVRRNGRWQALATGEVLVRPGK